MIVEMLSDGMQLNEFLFLLPMAIANTVVLSLIVLSLVDVFIGESNV